MEMERRNKDLQSSRFFQGYGTPKSIGGRHGKTGKVRGFGYVKVKPTGLFDVSDIGIRKRKDKNKSFGCCTRLWMA